MTEHSPQAVDEDAYVEPSMSCVLARMAVVALLVILVLSMVHKSVG